ncbi:uncharacterized protein LOC113386965 [Ctenocephalides felis]|uniref:uncharacterized protein LOC113386965 n=1 Tax=Ctenocephalides felis TaxID=7515 RepID=UPI000E6E585C|nr:uncharacterized protein LOC113386965 [Ctenocephalides felis]
MEFERKPSDVPRFSDDPQNHGKPRSDNLHDHDHHKYDQYYEQFRMKSAFQLKGLSSADCHELLTEDPHYDTILSEYEFCTQFVPSELFRRSLEESDSEDAPVDPGSPLVCGWDSIQYGVVSWKPCSILHPNPPIVYTRIDKYQDWIRNAITTQPENLNSHYVGGTDKNHLSLVIFIISIVVNEIL